MVANHHTTEDIMHPTMTTVRRGEYEARRDLPPIRRQRRDPRTGLVVEELAHMIDRKVFETWVVDGQKFGRWTWESGL